MTYKEFVDIMFEKFSSNLLPNTSNESRLLEYVEENKYLIEYEPSLYSIDDIRLIDGRKYILILYYN